MILCMHIGKTESCERAVEESRSFDSHEKYPARGVRSYGRFLRISLERRE